MIATVVRFSLSTLLLLPSPAFSVPGAPQPPWLREWPRQPNAVERAAQEFGRCIATGVRRLDETIVPEAGAAAVLDDCIAPLEKLERAATEVIAKSKLPDDRKAAAREELRLRLASAQARIAKTIRSRRMAANP